MCGKRFKFSTTIYYGENDMYRSNKITVKIDVCSLVPRRRHNFQKYMIVGMEYSSKQEVTWKKEMTFASGGPSIFVLRKQWNDKAQDERLRHKKKGKWNRQKNIEYGTKLRLKAFYVRKNESVINKNCGLESIGTTKKKKRKKKRSSH